MDQKLNEYTSIEDGVVFGAHEKSFVGFPADRPMLMLCDGAAGCGKSSQFVRPIVHGSIARGETVVVSGLLCEADYLKRAAAEGYRVVVISGRNPVQGEKWDMQDMAHISQEDFCRIAEYLWTRFVNRIMDWTIKGNSFLRSVFSALLQYAIDKDSIHSLKECASYCERGAGFVDVLSQYIEENHRGGVSESSRYFDFLQISGIDSTAKEELLQAIKAILEGQQSYEMEMSGQASFRIDDLFADKGKLMVMLDICNCHETIVFDAMMYRMLQRAWEIESKTPVRFVLDDVIGFWANLPSVKSLVSGIVNRGHSVYFTSQDLAQIVACGMGKVECQKFLYSMDAILFDDVRTDCVASQLLMHSDFAKLLDVSSEHQEDGWNILKFHAPRNIIGADAFFAPKLSVPQYGTFAF